jgi:hypothetical protein
MLEQTRPLLKDSSFIFKYKMVNSEETDIEYATTRLIRQSKTISQFVVYNFFAYSSNKYTVKACRLGE